MPKSTALLDGFSFVPSDGLPVVTLDKQKRFYLNAGLRSFIGVEAYNRIAIAYDPVNNALAIVKPEAGIAAADGSYYTVDKRHYISARRFLQRYPIDLADAPIFFEYATASEDGTTFIFRLKA
ncbi:hypothetical protein [Psychrobacillus sp. OK032]|uniref:hypothetical protein n=1 Tax=Psychrobacillus sp. OK032 TaxID=1884358 RepID=UPI0008B51056|nr:hypothetical protein [Psychrobacillus sp. OK032]SER87701.1 hypothetical protein SAMN05518872_102453 [Psychrobacillus sp. OK032]